MSLVPSNPAWQVYGSNGLPAAGALAYFYLATTNTPVDVYTEPTYTTAHPKPVVADANGVFPQMFFKAGEYKVTLKDSSGNLLAPTFDNWTVVANSLSFPLSIPSVIKTANYVVASGDRSSVIAMDATGIAGQVGLVTLDSVALGSGFPIWVTNVGAGTTELQFGAGQTLNGASIFDMSTTGQTIGLVSLGAAGWRALMGFGGPLLGPGQLSTLSVAGAAALNGPVAANSSFATLEQTLVVTAGAAAWNFALGPDAVAVSNTALNMNLPTGFANNMRGKLRITNSAAASIALTWNGIFQTLSGNLPSALPPGTAYFDYWVSGGVIYITRTNPNTILSYSVTKTTVAGASIDFSDIPVWAKRITVAVAGVSTNGTSPVIVQLGSAAVPEITGYQSNSWISGGSNPNSTVGFVTANNNAADLRYGHMLITNAGGNLWISSHILGTFNSNQNIGYGAKTLAALINFLRITTVNGTDTFDAGSVTVFAEG